MDNLTEEKSSIEVLNKDIQELKEEIRKLQSIIHDNQNKIEQIIRSAIDNIVEGNNTNYLEPFRIESLEKILEIMSDQKRATSSKPVASTVSSSAKLRQVSSAKLTFNNKPVFNPFQVNYYK
jgi:ferritin-like metal-binding protein YciE